MDRIICLCVALTDAVANLYKRKSITGTVPSYSFSLVARVVDVPWWMITYHASALIRRPSVCPHYVLRYIGRCSDKYNLLVLWQGNFLHTTYRIHPIDHNRGLAMECIPYVGDFVDSKNFLCSTWWYHAIEMLSVLLVFLREIHRSRGIPHPKGQ